jgi:hypothetical protein
VAPIFAPDLPFSANEELFLTLSSLAPTTTAIAWNGSAWANAPAWADRGGSLYNIVFGPELYLSLQHEDDE